MIGDYVYANIDGERKRVKVLEVFNNGIVCMFGGRPWFMDSESVLPIPVTEEILIKNGFVRIETKDGKSLPNYEIKWENNDNFVIRLHTMTGAYWEPCGLGTTIKGGAVCDVDYVHQLQHILLVCGNTRTFDAFVV